MQTELTFEVHAQENNAESQKHLDKNSPRFSAQCKKLFDYLIAGNKIDGDKARELFGIRHLPRRIKDIKDFNGYKISGKEWNEKKLQNYWMTQENINFNNSKLWQHKPQ